MPRSLALIALVLSAAALGACHRGADKQEGGKAGGEVLEGSISDAMLPLDTVKSQPPLAPQAAASGKGAAQAGDTASAAASEAPAADAVAKADAAGAGAGLPPARE